jgi:hypothetical protein
MDHEGTREQLELAAIEPGGLERLMAGDTATAQAVAAHLAGCASCSDELVRLGRASALIREGIRELPPPDLKARTLAAIRTEGVRRPLLAAAAPSGAVAGAAALTTIPSGPASPEPVALPVAAVAARNRPSRGQVIGWFGAIAAAVVLSVLATSFLIGSRVDEQLAVQSATVAALEKLTTATLDVTAQPDAQHVALTGVTDPKLDGNLVFSPTTTELVVVSYDLANPPAGQEYRCWVEVNGQRARVGKMFFSNDLAYWAGDVAAVSGLSGAATFGVSLVDDTGGSIETDPVLAGHL